jgi:hypothetical protein
MVIQFSDGPVAQSVEQRIENPCVGGSIPPQATKLYFVCCLQNIVCNTVGLDF